MSQENGRRPWLQSVQSVKSVELVFERACQVPCIDPSDALPQTNGRMERIGAGLSVKQKVVPSVLGPQLRLVALASRDDRSQ